MRFIKEALDQLYTMACKLIVLVMAVAWLADQVFHVNLIKIF